MTVNAGTTGPGDPGRAIRPMAGLSSEIERRVASRFHVNRGTLHAPGRCSERIAFARHVAMYLERVLLELSYGDIARRFGRHPTTVIYACRRIEDLRDDTGFDRRLAAIEQAVQARADEARP